MKRLERILKALANPRRLAILAYLKRAHEANVGRIGGEIHLSLVSTSKHVVILYRAGLLEKEQRSVEVFYRLAKPPEVFVDDLLKKL